MAPTCPNGCDETPVGIEVFGLYDGVAYWKCPACGLSWHRFPAPGRIRDRLAVIAPHVIDREEKP